MKFTIALLVTIAGLNVQAQAPAAPASKPAPAATAKKGAAPAKITKIKIDYENETVLGNYDTPDAQFINSRRMIKFKELFNRRTNFIEEVEANKGLFNEYQK
ncbi:MAG: hypothetical protein K2P92_03735 [Bdellovibrionaceae bacterium]|nr:hypothetical protein [Pseudobdellovibrionaceae bacterium]